MKIENETNLEVTEEPDNEYGDYPESSLWWDEDYDRPDYYSYIPYNIDHDFDWDDNEGDA